MTNQFNCFDYCIVKVTETVKLHKLHSLCRLAEVGEMLELVLMLQLHNMHTYLSSLNCSNGTIYHTWMGRLKSPTREDWEKTATS